MDTSNSPIGSFTIARLRERGIPEDIRDAEKAELIIKTILDRLRPIAKYLAKPVNMGEIEYPGDLYGREDLANVRIRRIVILSDAKYRTLFLDEGCNVRKAYMPGDHRQLGEAACDAAAETPFAELIALLNDALKRAEQERERHLASIKERSQLLDEILSVIECKRPSAPKKPHVVSGDNDVVAGPDYPVQRPSSILNTDYPL